MQYAQGVLCFIFLWAVQLQAQKQQLTTTQYEFYKDQETWYYKAIGSEKVKALRANRLFQNIYIPEDNVSNVAVSSDDQHLAFAISAKVRAGLKVYSLKDRRFIAQNAKIDCGSPYSFCSAVSMFFAKDNAKLYATGYAGDMISWDWNKDEVETQIDSSNFSYGIYLKPMPDQGGILKYDHQKAILVDAEGKMVWEINYKGASDFNGTKVELSPDGKHLLVLLMSDHDDSPATGLELYDAKTGKLQFKTDIKEMQRYYSIRFSKDSKHFAGLMEDGKLEVWNLKGKKIFENYVQQNEYGFFLDFSADHRCVMAATGNQCKVYDLKGKALVELETPMKIQNGVYFPEHQVIALWSEFDFKNEGKRLQFYSLSGKLLETYVLDGTIGHGDMPQTLAHFYFVANDVKLRHKGNKPPTLMRFEKWKLGLLSALEDADLDRVRKYESYLAK